MDALCRAALESLRPGKPAVHGSLQCDETSNQPEAGIWHFRSPQGMVLSSLIS